MKNEKTVNPNKAVLMKWIDRMTNEQAEKMARFLPFLRFLSKLSINSLVFSEVFLRRVVKPEGKGV